MRNRFVRRYGFGQLQFITCSCYRRRPFFNTPRARNLFLKILTVQSIRVHAAAVVVASG